MKICSKCGNEKEIDEFPINKTRKDGHGNACKTCQNEYTKAHYHGNKKQYRDRNKRRTKETREYVIEYKKKSVCKNCGEDRWWVLDFHHVDEKRENISRLLTHGVETVKKEIKKCVILCANCHRNLHFQTNNAPVAQLDNASHYECEDLGVRIPSGVQI